MKDIFRVIDKKNRETSFEYDLKNNDEIDLTIAAFIVRDTDIQIRVKLNENAKFNGKIALLGSGTHKVNIDYLAVHSGKNSKSVFRLNGVLANGIEKQTKMKIQFRPGAKNAEGSEFEKITMLDDSCKNICLPIIDSSEEEMHGSHGMSSGKIDKNIRRYLASRGLSKNKIQELLIKSDIFALLKNIDKNQIQLVEEQLNIFCEENNV